MKFAVFFLFFIHYFIPCIAQDVNALIKEAQKQEQKPDEKSAFNIYKQALQISPDNIDLLAKCSELCSSIGNRETNSGRRDVYYKAAISYARKAINLQPKNDDANVAMAIAMGRTALVKSGKEKISAVKNIKHYADKAILYNPSNFKAWHILGKWYYEVSQLNMMERAATKLFFGGLPDASFEKAINAYEKARALHSTFALNYLELAKAYWKNDQEAKAVSLIRHLLTLPLRTEDDLRIKAEAQQLLNTWKS